MSGFAEFLPLDSRLRAVADAVRPGSVVADVGTDHGYLICDLVGSGKCPHGYASDVKEGPLEAARATIHSRGLASRVTALLSDGLHGLPDTGIEDIVLAGMGGELIGELLTAVPWTRNPSLRFVLQPMTRAAHLRRLLYREGFALLRETGVRSGRFVYTVMTAAWTGEHRTVDELFAETGLLISESGAEARAYLQRVCARLRKQAEGLAASKNPEDQARAAKSLRLAARIAEIGEGAKE